MTIDHPKLVKLLQLAYSAEKAAAFIERKVEMFPDDQRQIVSAKIVMVGKNYHIEVESATL